MSEGMNEGDKAKARFEDWVATGKLPEQCEFNDDVSLVLNLRVVGVQLARNVTKHPGPNYTMEFEPGPMCGYLTCDGGKGKFLFEITERNSEVVLGALRAQYEQSRKPAEQRALVAKLRNLGFGANLYTDGSVDVFDLDCRMEDRGLVSRTRIEQMAAMSGLCQRVQEAWSSYQYSINHPQHFEVKEKP